MISSRLTFWNCVILSLVLTAVGLGIYFTTQHSLFTSIDDDLKQRADLMTATWHGPPPINLRRQDGPPPPDRQRINVEAAEREGISPIQVRQNQLEDSIVRPNFMNVSGQPFRKEDVVWDPDSVQTVIRTGKRMYGYGEVYNLPIRTITVPMREDGKVGAIVQFAHSMSGVDEEMDRLGKTLLLVLPLAVVAMLITGVVLTKRALLPMASIASTAEQIEATNLQSRLPVLGRDEFAYLSQTFNGMLERLDSAFKAQELAAEKQRQFVSDASHELKSPLTAIKVRTGIALTKDLPKEKYVEHLAAIDRASTTMSALVQDLLILAAADEGQLVRSQAGFSIDALVRDAVDAVDPGDHPIEIDVDPEFKFFGDLSSMTRVLVNLLNNAIQHSPSGQPIRIRAAKGVIEVEDHGSGIPAEHMPMIFDRFHRPDASRDRASGGTGLGLAIAKAIIEAHHGTISLSSVEGQGTTATIRLE